MTFIMTKVHRVHRGGHKFIVSNGRVAIHSEEGILMPVGVIQVDTDREFKTWITLPLDDGKYAPITSSEAEWLRRAGFTVEFIVNQGG